MLRMIYNKPLLLLAYIQHKKLMNFSQISIYNPMHRDKIHNIQKVADYMIIKYLIENHIQG